MKGYYFYSGLTEQYVKNIFEKPTLPLHWSQQLDTDQKYVEVHELLKQITAKRKLLAGEEDPTLFLPTPVVRVGEDMSKSMGLTYRIYSDVVEILFERLHASYKRLSERTDRHYPLKDFITFLKNNHRFTSISREQTSRETSGGLEQGLYQCEEDETCFYVQSGRSVRGDSLIQVSILDTGDTYHLSYSVPSSSEEDAPLIPFKISKISDFLNRFQKKAVGKSGSDRDPVTEELIEISEKIFKRTDSLPLSYREVELQILFPLSAQFSFLCQNFSNYKVNYHAWMLTDEEHEEREERGSSLQIYYSALLTNLELFEESFITRIPFCQNWVDAFSLKIQRNRDVTLFQLPQLNEQYETIKSTLRDSVIALNFSESVRPLLKDIDTLMIKTRLFYTQKLEIIEKKILETGLVGINFAEADISTIVGALVEENFKLSPSYYDDIRWNPHVLLEYNHDAMQMPIKLLDVGSPLALREAHKLSSSLTPKPYMRARRMARTLSGSHIDSPRASKTPPISPIRDLMLMCPGSIPPEQIREEMDCFSLLSSPPDSPSLMQRVPKIPSLKEALNYYIYYNLSMKENDDEFADFLSGLQELGERAERLTFADELEKILDKKVRRVHFPSKRMLIMIANKNRLAENLIDLKTYLPALKLIRDTYQFLIKQKANSSRNKLFEIVKNATSFNQVITSLRTKKSFLSPPTKYAIIIEALRKVTNDQKTFILKSLQAAMALIEVNPEDPIRVILLQLETDSTDTESGVFSPLPPLSITTASTPEAVHAPAPAAAPAAASASASEKRSQSSTASSFVFAEFSFMTGPVRIKIPKKTQFSQRTARPRLTVLEPSISVVRDDPMVRFLYSTITPSHSIHELTTMPEDFLQHGVESIVNSAYKDSAFKGLAPGLRLLAVNLVSEKINRLSDDDLKEYYNNIRTLIQEEIQMVNERLARNPTNRDAGSQKDFLSQLLRYLPENMTDIEEAKRRTQLVTAYSAFMHRNKVYADIHLEGRALAEHFKITLILNHGQVVHQGPENTRVLGFHHNGRQGLAAHYSIFGATHGDGNCLFNAFAQGVADIYVKEYQGIPEGRSAQQQRYAALMNPRQAKSSAATEMVFCA